MRKANLSKHLFGLFIFICTVCLLIGFPPGRAQALTPPAPAPDSLSILYGFGTATNDGNYPTGNLTLSADGTTLYGMTQYGGTDNTSDPNGGGAIFQIGTNGAGYKVLYRFAGGTSDGAYPYGSLTLVGSTLYGMTSSGGAHGFGTIFSFSLGGTTDKVLYSFGGGSDGAYPTGNLTLSGSTLYGMASGSNPNGNPDDSGTIFQINTNGTGYQVLYNFGNITNDGTNPYGSLTLSADGTTLYGMTSQGGANYNGAIFSFPVGGTADQVLYSFGGVSNDGANPWGDLTLSADGTTLYGMTQNGGANSNGAIFSFVLGGTVDTVLYSFGGVSNDGANPTGSLTLSGSTLYGMTQFGGANGGNYSGNGTIFQINTDSTGYFDLYSFTGGSDGNNPCGSFTLSADGSTLYGMASWGGANGNGAIFSMGAATLEAPAAPANVMAAAGNASAAVSFTPPQYYIGPAITSYTVTPYDLTSLTPGTPVTGVTSSPVIVPVLNNGDAYTFTVTATNSVGNSAASTSNSVTPSATPIPSAIAATWNFAGITTGSPSDPDALSNNSFSEAIASDGTFTITGGNADGASGTLWIFPNGTVPVILVGGVDVIPNMLCQINSEMTVVVCTDTSIDGYGTTELNIGTKQASFNTGDLQGTWEGDFLIAEQPSSGQNGQTGQGESATVSATIGSTGNYTGTFTQSGETSKSISGQFSMLNGVITCSSASSGCPNNYTGFLDSGKTVMVGTSSKDSDAEISLFIQKASSYSRADLAGTWQSNELDSGDDAPYWERDTITISSTGTFTMSYTGSDGSTGSGTGQLSISSTGVLSCVSGSCSDHSSSSRSRRSSIGSSSSNTMPVMDKSKTVMVMAKSSTDSNGGTSGSITIFTKIPASVPGAPTIGPATAGAASATVSFTAPASDGGGTITSYTATPYDVTTSTPGTPVSSQSGTVTSITVTGLNNGDSYTFTVTATNASGTGPASGPSNPVTPEALLVAPTGVTATASTTQQGTASVSFNPPAADSGDTYNATSIPGNITGTATTTSPIPVTGLTPGASYKFTVTASAPGAESPASSPSPTIKMPAAPGAPTGVTATAGDAEATVKFRTPASNGSPITSYTVTPYNVTNGTPGTPGTPLTGVSATATSTPVTGLTPGDSYTFTVTAINAINTGPASSPSAKITLPTAPGMPTGVTATASTTIKGQATVKFTAPANGGDPITSYTVTPYNVTTSTPGTPLTGVKISSATVKSLTPGDAYTFTVTAINAMGTGTASSPSSQITMPSAPGMPTGVTATASTTIKGQATVSFTAPASTGGDPITSYIVTPYNVTNGTPGTAGTPVKGLATARSIIVKGLISGDSYTFTVAAANVIGTGPAAGPTSPVISH